MKRKRVLVMGGAGFLGSHLCDRLVREGSDVICVDNLFTGTKDNIRHLLANPYFEFVRHDVTQPVWVECDQIYNLACPASPVWYQRDPIYTTKTSIVGALNALGLAKRTGARVLQASTSEVYGDPASSPQDEGYRGNVNTTGPRACYDEGKRAAETLFFDYHRQHGVDITIYGDGSQTRSFCYVDDLIEGMVRLMNSRDGFTGPVNIGNPDEFTIKQLAEIIIEMTSSPSKLVYKELPQDDPTQRRPDITLAQKELGWKPTVKLREGLERTITYFRGIV